MKSPSGIVARCSTSYNFGGINKFVIAADKGQFGLEPAFSYGGIQGFVGDQPIDRPNVDQFVAEMDAFAESIQRGERSKVSGEKGLRGQLVIEAIHQSVQSGQTEEVAGMKVE